MKSYITEKALEEAEKMEIQVESSEESHTKKPGEVIKILLERYAYGSKLDLSKLLLLNSNRGECDTYSALCDVTNMLIGHDLNDVNQYVIAKEQQPVSDNEKADDKFEIEWLNHDLPQTTWYIFENSVSFTYS